MSVNINFILNDLKDGRHLRTQASLDTLNEILETYYNNGQRDFSVTQIGRLSVENGGPGYQSIRATQNKHYRTLIEAWAAKAGTTTKKPITELSRSREVPADNQLLERLADPALRALFGQIIAERNRYRKELNLLKQHANIVIDKRPIRHLVPTPESVKVLPALTGLLTPIEIKALAYAISDECMEKQDWQYTKAGQIKSEEYGQEIFPRGFVNGIQKILKDTDHQ